VTRARAAGVGARCREVVRAGGTDAAAGGAAAAVGGVGPFCGRSVSGEARPSARRPTTRGRVRASGVLLRRCGHAPVAGSQTKIGMSRSVRARYSAYGA
jgi:hypothetical protein